MKEGKLIKELKELEHRIKEELDEHRRLRENTELDLLKFYHEGYLEGQRVIFDRILEIISAYYEDRLEDKKMKRIVNGKLYDTDTAELVCQSNISRFVSRLYRTKKGRYFVYEKIGDIEDIKPLNEDGTFEWLSKHNTDKAIELFSERIEEA